MIKPINISPINTSKHLEFTCRKCEMRGTITLTNSVVNTNNKGESEIPLDYDYPKCGNKL